MAQTTIRGYRGADEDALLALWNRALPIDPIDPRTFRRKVLLDPNFHPDWLLLAHAGAEPVGFCLNLIRRHPLEKVGLQEDAGWISALGVLPERRGQGVGQALLDASLQLFRGAARRHVSVAPYIPNYFVPGVDVNHYADGLRFLLHRGFAEVDRPMAMDAPLVPLDLSYLPARAQRLWHEQQVAVRPLRPAEIPDLLALLQAHMPGDWVRHARSLLQDITAGRGVWEQFTVALRDGEVVGYCQFEDEHFGPFGVRDDMQGRGIGTVLLGTCLQAMRAQGVHTAFVLWTSDANASKVYGRFGFTESRRFAVLRRPL